ncbi:RNA polymerase sigma 70 [Ligilactobacillus salitolerans]|uniref:RNA polymerase sigma 70 n=1 Tax=Ligilactobacillus salitolerans TaxID=1808352 RepID=A0A401ITX2_9LACO|nr:RNA polymerase sigma 70 [Ligilactobacillus salitolerans]
MGLLPELDQKKTAEAVRCFFKKEYPIALRIAGKNYNSLRSPVMDGMPSATIQDKDRDKAIVKHADATLLIDNVKRAVQMVNEFDDTSGQILLKAYADRKSATQIAMDIGYSASRVSQLQQNALCQFADYFEFLTRIDLHVWCSREITG